MTDINSNESLTALLSKPECWESLDDKTLDHLVHATACLYGVSNDQALVGTIIGLYAIFRDRFSARQRMFNYEAVRQRVEQGEIGPSGLMPFLLCDDDRQIVSTAALDFAVLQAEEDDPMAGVNMLLDWVANEVPINPGAVLGGLVVCGDRRVIDLLIPHRSVLTDSVISEIVHCHSGLIIAGSVEFYLDWLAGLDSKDNAAIYGVVAAGLANQVMGARDKVVRDIERSLPVGQGDAIRFKKEWSLKDYAQEIAPRLRAIANREQGEPIMPHVLKAWGIA